MYLLTGLRKPGEPWQDCGQMDEDELEGLTKAELIRLILAQAEQLAKLQGDYDALKMKFDQRM